MQLPSPNASTEVYLMHGDHLEGALEAWIDMPTLSSSQQQTLAGQAESIRGANTSLRDAAVSAGQADRAARKARARYAACDVLLDLRVMNLSDALLNGPALRSRQHPVYQQVFQGQTPSAITAIRRYDQPEAVSQLLTRFDAVEDFEGKGTARTNLKDALDRSLAARDAMDEAEMAANTAGDAELSSRLALRAALEQVYGLLRSLFPGRRDFVESFFLRRERDEKAAGTVAGGEG